MRPLICAVVFALCLVAVASAHAAEPSDADAIRTSPKREVPDYDGVPPPPSTAEQKVAWVPRVIFFPLYVVSEYVIRRPLGWLIVAAERGNWPSEIISFFTFGEGNIGIVPTTFIDLGFRPTVGFYFFWNRMLHRRHDFRLRASVWADGFTFSMANRVRVGSASRLQLRTEAVRRPDNAFYGVGARTLDEDLTRFGMDRFTAELSFTGRLGWGDAVRLAFTARDQRFRETTCCSGVPLDDAIAMGLVASPTGYAEGGYTAFVGHLDANVDSRSPQQLNGVRLAAGVDLGTATEGLGSWARVSGTAGGFVDVSGGMARVVGLTVSAAMVEPLGDAMDVPFLELVDFGGGAAMPGFRAGRLRGRSGVSASLRYEWPIWAALAGSMQVEIGNVFGPRFEDFDTNLLRLSAGFGMRSVGPNDHELQFLIGFGTETFDQGADLTSIRLAIGGTYGF